MFCISIYPCPWVAFPDPALWLYSAVTEEERRERRERHLPHFVIRLKDTEILERASVVFMVKAEGQPEPTIEL